MTYSKYYNSYGQRIKNVSAYASTGAPMYKNFTNKYGEKIYNPTAYVNAGGSLYSNKNINEKKTIYKVECDKGVKYIGETGNFNKRANQHFNGTGSQVTQKYKPKSIKKLDKVPGYFAKEVEQEYTDYYIDKYGYDKVRGGKYTNSYTLNNKK